MNGTVTAYRMKVGAETTSINLRVLRPIGSPLTAPGTQFQAVGTDGAQQAPPPNSTTTWPTNMPIAAGDLVGIYCCPSFGSPPIENSIPGSVLAEVPGASVARWGDFWQPGPQDGGPALATAPQPGVMLMLQAVIEPENSFKVLEAQVKKRNKATVVVSVPNRGTVAVAGRTVRPVSKNVRSAGKAS